LITPAIINIPNITEMGPEGPENSFKFRLQIQRTDRLYELVLKSEKVFFLNSLKVTKYNPVRKKRQ